MRLPIVWIVSITATLMLTCLAIFAAQSSELAPLSTAQPDPAIRERIRAFETGIGRRPNDLVSFTGPDNRPVYLFTAPCCDQFNPLYDAEGRFICAPTGGFAGSGDGKCPAWVGMRKHRLPAPIGTQPTAPHETP